MLVPAVTGDFGVMPGHVPTVAQLRPGVVTIHTEMDKEIEKFFVSSGFAFVHADSSADVVAVEAVKLSDLDEEAVRAGLQVILTSLSSHSVESRQNGLLLTGGSILSSVSNSPLCQCLAYFCPNLLSNLLFNSNHPFLATLYLVIRILHGTQSVQHHKD